MVATDHLKWPGCAHFYILIKHHSCLQHGTFPVFSDQSISEPIYIHCILCPLEGSSGFLRNHAPSRMTNRCGMKNERIWSKLDRVWWNIIWRSLSMLRLTGKPSRNWIIRDYRMWFIWTMCSNGRSWWSASRYSYLISISSLNIAVIINHHHDWPGPVRSADQIG